jgi:hypothetical protein
MVGKYGLDSLAQDRGQWLALVNTVIKLGSHKGRGVS